MTLGVVLALGAGVLSALPLLVPGGLLFALLSPLPLFLVGLSQGLRGVTIAALAACGITVLLAGPLGALSIAIVLAGPAVLLVRQALLNRPAPDGGLEWYPPGQMIIWLTGIGVVWMFLSIMLLGSGSEGIEATLRADFDEALALMVPEMQEQARNRMSDLAVPFALGAGPLAWLGVLAVNGILAQGALLRLGRALRPAPDIKQMELPRWLDVTAAVVLAVALLASGDIGYIAQNLLILLLLPYLFAGLAVAHRWIGRTGAAAPLLLVPLYVLLLLGWVAPLVVGLGLIDQVVGHHRRKSGGRPDQEEE
ncbi:MAG: DUF2232 domain-containing protein [Kiloniellales bacterium]